MNKKRWISRELKHLSEHMDLALIDIQSGNLQSAETNLRFAMSIVKEMGKRDKESVRSLEKAGKTINSLRKFLRPLIKEAALESIKVYAREKGRKK